MATGVNLWKVDCSFTAPAGFFTTGIINYTIYKRVPDGTTAEKKAIAEASVTGDAALVRAAAPSWHIVTSAERNDLITTEVWNL